MDKVFKSAYIDAPLKMMEALTVPRREEMGLDQIAWSDEPTRDESDSMYTWRKHAKLQAFFEDIWYNKLGNTERFNDPAEIELTRELIEELKTLIEKDELPISQGGFFYGHQFQEESARDYKQQDLEFCNWALGELKNGKSVYYCSNW
jgi:hypothetical protein